MLANRVKETTATTGTGSFTTAGAVDGFQTFNNAFGTNYFFKYRAVDETNNTWERGIGYLSDSTTLVRTTILENSSGAYTAINFATAPSLFVDIGMHDIQAAPKYITSADQKPSNIFGLLATKALIASREYYHHYYYMVHHITSVSIEVTTAAASGKIARIAIYDTLTTGQAGAKIAETATFLVDTTGVKNASISVPEGVNGWLWMMVISDGAPTLRSPNADSVITHDAPTMFNDYGMRQNTSGSGVIAPSPAATGLTAGTKGFLIAVR